MKERGEKNRGWKRKGEGRAEGGNKKGEREGGREGGRKGGRGGISHVRIQLLHATISTTCVYMLQNLTVDYIRGISRCLYSRGV